MLFKLLLVILPWIYKVNQDFWNQNSYCCQQVHSEFSDLYQDCTFCQEWPQLHYVSWNRKNLAKLNSYFLSLYCLDKYIYKPYRRSSPSQRWRGHGLKKQINIFFVIKGIYDELYSYLDIFYPIVQPQYMSSWYLCAIPDTSRLHWLHPQLP